MLCENCEHFAAVESKISWGYGHTVFQCPKINAVRFSDWSAISCPHFNRHLPSHDNIDNQEK